MMLFGAHDPPMRSSFSKIVTENCWLWRNFRAAMRPAGPAPMMATDFVIFGHRFLVALFPYTDLDRFLKDLSSSCDKKAKLAKRSRRRCGLGYGLLRSVQAYGRTLDKQAKLLAELGRAQYRYKQLHHSSRPNTHCHHGNKQGRISVCRVRSPKKHVLYSAYDSYEDIMSRRKVSGEAMIPANNLLQGFCYHAASV